MLSVFPYLKDLGFTDTSRFIQSVTTLTSPKYRNRNINI
nr:MAG TPA: LisH-like dimerization domain protein [Caudoviricetes sp.]